MADDLERRHRSDDTQVLRQRRPGHNRLPVREAPAPAPPLKKPSLLGGLLGRKPTTTLGAQIERWYENAGGLGKAIDAAQASQAQRDAGVLNDKMWPKWKPSDVTERTPPIQYSDHLPADTNGFWTHSGQVWLANGNTLHHQATLEHELGHNAISRDRDTITGQRASVKDSPASWTAPQSHNFGDDGQYAAYLMGPHETDVRLAEVKRHYAHHTGRLVDSPEEAKKAWDWYRENNLMFSPTVNSNVERPGESPTMGHEQFKFYDSLPADAKKQMWHRMPELVKGGLLDGLRRPTT